jgi:ATP-dependent helicase HrpB
LIALPIDPHLPAIVRDVRAHNGLVLVAEPGAGKTTRVPRALLDAGFGEHGEIVVVEPRRIAARMAAARVAHELGEEVGRRVGYRVRFDTAVSRETRITFVTEGILARKLDRDPSLGGIGAIVFDELHERHLDTDLGLARARLARERGRSDLAILAMSATLEAEPVARFLDAPITNVEGRAFPVEVRFSELDERPLERRVRAALVRLVDEGIEGDILVFLPGAGEIRRAMSECEGPASAHGIDLVPLHGDLSAADQDRAVRRGPRRKAIFATNVAETSITIESVTAVIDSGLARVARSDPWSGLSSLAISKVSRASAAQRAGRAGRTRPGVCIRLYTKGDHDARPIRDRPEIARADLASMVLSLRATGEDPVRFPYLEPPPPAALDAASSLLAELGAIEEALITELGRAMLEVPAHPRLARLAIEAKRRGHARSGAWIAAIAGEREVRRRTFGAREETRDVASSDLIARLDQIEARDRELDANAVRAVRSAAEAIERALPAVDETPTFDEEDALLIATLAGFPDRVAKRRASGDLVLAGGGTARLDPASVVQEAELLVAIDAEAQGSATLVRRASATRLEHLMELFFDRLEEARDVRFDSDRERVVAARELRYRGLALERTIVDPLPEEAAPVLADAALAVGLRRFADEDALASLERRLRFARQFDPALPELDRGRLRALLVSICEGRRSFAELTDAGVLDLVRAELGASVLAKLETLAPEAISIPGRKRIAIHYEDDRPPWIESRLQDFFGSSEGPRIAQGRVPLVLHLLAPNKRAVQVTTDLSGFWARHYPTVKSELRRRYPRHAWPDDPRVTPPPPPPRR